MTDLAHRVQAIEDRTALTDLLSRYCRTLDDADLVGLRSCVTDDLHAEHGGMIPPIDGADAFLAVLKMGTDTE